MPFSGGSLIGVRSARGSTGPTLNKPFPRPMGLKGGGERRNTLVDAHGMAPLKYVLSPPSDVALGPATYRFVNY